MTQPVNFSAQPPLALYIHVPWCVLKCPYCDFNSHEARGGFPEDDYVAALVRDLELSLPEIWGRGVYSIFIGGGTPSLLSVASIEKLLQAVYARLPVDVNAEVTLEANPGTAEAEKFAGFKRAGVNRLSIGIQSFDDAHLKALGRIHDANEARRAVEMARHCFDNVNLDLMYGLPHQTANAAEQDVRTAIEFGPQHLSCYHLTVEPNTRFAARPPELPTDEASGEMERRISGMLAERGYVHYETSAFALPLRQSRHNLNYWKFGDYLGIGAGAHSKLTFHDRVTRKARVKRPEAYMAALAENEAVQSAHDLSPRDLAFEFMMNALRLNDGFDAELFQERTSLPLAVIDPELEQAEARGLLIHEGGRIAPTELGRRFLNDLLEMFLR